MADGSAPQSPSDDLFEPLTPDRSPSNLFMSDEGDEDEEQVWSECLLLACLHSITLY